jgi:PAS domain S-box-containing protein
VVDDQGLIMYGNEAMIALGGWGLIDGAGTNILDYLHPDDRDWVTEAFLQLVRTMPDHDVNDRWGSIHFRMIARNGSVVPLEVTGSGNLFDSVVGGVIYDVRPARVQEVIGNVLTGAVSDTLVGELLNLVLDAIAAPPLELHAAVLQTDQKGFCRVIASTSARMIECFDVLAGPFPWSDPSPTPVFLTTEDLPFALRSRQAIQVFEDFWYIAVESPIPDDSCRIIACTSVHHLPAHGAVDRLARARELAGVVLMRAQTDALLARAAYWDDLTKYRKPSRFFSRRGEALRGS